MRARLEFFPGVGVTELLAVAAGGVIGALLQLVPMALPLPVAQKLEARALAFLLPLGAAYLLVKQDATGNSLWSLLKASRAWKNRPKVYYYRRGGYS